MSLFGFIADNEYAPHHHARHKLIGLRICLLLLWRTNYAHAISFNPSFLPIDFFGNLKLVLCFLHASSLFNLREMLPHPSAQHLYGKRAYVAMMSFCIQVVHLFPPLVSPFQPASIEIDIFVAFLPLFLGSVFGL